ncbi:Crp/Fnr family transcriptional regulator [Rufibacter sediminis]|uniref:Crp/Fnr family transcriptional regulator n=1 Tax=Rufibacter sediminis TaxID=2762756 RepID=A0ABR6VTD1_9BACT|nr:Crp/Fnr family transcriptional regulator [Rufibacter sediminis]MBC3540400.1 Crp/Fnr family transcriptional regulator [Rufibacter sediminis]
MKNGFLRFLENTAPLSDGLKEALQESLKGPYPIKKGTILLREGEISTTAYFIIQGMARMYYKVNNKEVTSRFIPEDSIAIPYYSFLSQQPSYESMDVLETSQVLSINRLDFENLYEQYPELHNLMRQQLAKALIQSDERGMMIRKLQAKERYEVLLKKYPDIFLRASVEQIATFLGIRRETLARIRTQSRV